MKKIAVVGDTFIDEYVYGEVKRLSPEAPIPIFLPKAREIRPGGAANVANNLFHLGLKPILFSITSQKLPFPVIDLSRPTDLKITRFVTGNYTLLRVDEPERYLLDENGLALPFPEKEEFDIIAFIDYGMGIIKGGEADIVDTLKRDLSVFRGSQILKVNGLEYHKAINRKVFPKAFVTRGSEGIDYYEHGIFVSSEPANKVTLVDPIGAGDTVTAIIIYCLLKGWTNPQKIMRLANKGAGMVVKKFGTSFVTEKELLT